MKVGNDVTLEQDLTVEGSTTLQNQLSVGSDVNVQGQVTSIGQMNAPAFHQTSDYRLKSNVRELPDTEVEDAINKMRPVEYWMEGDRKLGFLAHELQLAHLTRCVATGYRDGPKTQTVDYSQIIPVLVKYIQMQDQKITDLENRIQQLEFKQ